MDNIYATISADIVASTSLPREDFRRLTQHIKVTLDNLASQYQGFWGRLVKGDSIECVMANPNNALRIALLLKTLVKSFAPYDDMVDEGFKRYGLRLAIGIGDMRDIDKEFDIMKGDAICLSGRALDKIKETRVRDFHIDVSSGISYDIGMSIIAQFLSRRIDEATSRQCETLFYRLQCKKDDDVAKIMNISRAGVNSNLRSMDWDLINRSICLFEKYKFKRKKEKDQS